MTEPKGQDVLHRICVGALVARNECGLTILLGHRAPTRPYFPDVWDLPGGHCELGESKDEALVRELQEEIGITPTRWRFLGDLNAGTFAPGPVDLSAALDRTFTGIAAVLAAGIASACLNYERLSAPARDTPMSH